MHTTKDPNHTVRYNSRLWIAAALLLSVLFLLACTAPNGLTLATAAGTPQGYSGVVESVLKYSMPVLPTPAPTEEAPLQVVINTGGSRANIRSAPGLNSEIVAKANPGDLFTVVGKSEDDAWWQICCVNGDQNAWVSDSVVSVAGTAEAVQVTGSSEPLLSSELTANYGIDWTCKSEEGRCTVDACKAQVGASVNREATQYIPVEYQVQWDDECFDTDSWVFEVDPYTGKERTGEYADNFLYSYWIGANAGEISGVYPYGDAQGIVVYCNGPQTVEIEEGDGWTSVYEGFTCHDRKTGMLVHMDYDKRWLFTGTVDGKNVERAYFGDTEHLEQSLLDTNSNLFFVEEK
jgi:hypothetical protein